jgi:hypothetical protein
MSFTGKMSFGFLDDLHGTHIATVGFKQFAKVISAFSPEFIRTSVNGIIEANLSEIVSAARAKAEARRRSGFMIEQTNYQMTGDMTGVAFSLAPYAFAQDKGFTTPTGGKVTGLNFWAPAAFSGTRQFVADMAGFLQGLLRSGTFKARAIKSITRGSVTRLATANKSSGVHRYVSKIALGGGKYRYKYPPNQSGRFTRVLKPGTGKGFGQVGRKRRTV